MLPRSRRLRALEVKEVLARGHSVRAGQFSAKFFHTKELSRVAVVVPKSTARRAVERNRLRRTLYRALEPLLPARPPSRSGGPTHGLWMVLLLRGPLPVSDTATLPHNLKALLRKIVEKNV